MSIRNCGTRRNYLTQSLSYPIRLPDVVQADALRLLEVSREVINATVSALWDQLDAFGVRETTFAYKRIMAKISSSNPHGDRQWRCEAEQAGRILRAQAARKKRFALIMPILSQDMILLKTEKQAARKDRKAIRAALLDLSEEHTDGGSAVELQSLIEQSCNFYLKHGRFPKTYEEMQAMPVLKVGILPYAGDDGGTVGQAYRLRLDLEQRCCFFAFRSPDEALYWSPTWTEPQMLLPLPDPVIEHLQAGGVLAPTLREIQEADDTRCAVLDFIVEVPVTEPVEWNQTRRVLGWDWGVRTLVTVTVLDLDGNQIAPPLFLDSGGFDGRQAHTKRHIDRLKSKVAKLEAQRDRSSEKDPRREPVMRKLSALHREIAYCWRKYSARNRDLAHLTANVLLLLADVWEVELIAGESLKSLKTTGHGRSAKGRWVRWRNNSQIRGVLWRCLRYKCHLTGIRLEWQQPKGTSHTCPRCGKFANTYASPEHLTAVVDSGAWLSCVACGWNGARDYAASVNIARLGIAFKMYINGWIKAVTLHSAFPLETLLRLRGQQYLKTDQSRSTSQQR